MTNIYRFRPPQKRNRLNWLVPWATVLVLLGMLSLLHYFRPEWTNIEIGSRQKPAADNRDPNANRGRRYHAVDGDSFRIGTIEIRLQGIDAPELRQTCVGIGSRQHPCGRLAREALSKLVLHGAVKCVLLEKDRYGRELSQCHSGALDINLEMIRSGWAVAYLNAPMSYRKAEREAKAAKRGIWAWRFEIPQDYRNRNRAVEGNMLGED